MSPTRPGGQRSPRLVLGVVVPLGLGLALIGGLLYLIGPEAAFATLGRLRPWQGLTLLGVALASMACTSLSQWVILGRYGHRVHPWLLFRLTILAFTVGWLVPSGYVAGFPVAAYLLTRHGVPFGHGLASFLIERFLEMAAYTIILPAVLLAGLPSGGALVAAVLAPFVGVTLVSLDLVLGWRIGRRSLTSLLGRVPRLVTPALERGVDFLGTVSSFFRSSRGLVLAAFACSVLAIAGMLVRALLSVWFLHLPLGVPHVALLVAGSLLVFALPLVPGAVGVYEGGMVALFGLLGRPAAEGIAYAMIMHGVELLVAAVGVVFLVQFGMSLARAREVTASPRR